MRGISNDLQNTISLSELSPRLIDCERTRKSRTYSTLLGIDFKDATMQQVWKWFTDAQRSDLSSEDALTRFVNFWNSGEGKEMYADQKKIDDKLKTLDDEINGIIL